MEECCLLLKEFLMRSIEISFAAGMDYFAMTVEYPPEPAEYANMHKAKIYKGD